MVECRDAPYHSNEINPHLRPRSPVTGPMDFAAGCDIGANQYADIATASCLHNSYPSIIIYRANSCVQTATNATVMMDPMLCKNLAAVFSGQTGYQELNVYFEACPKAAMTPTEQVTMVMNYMANTCGHAIGIVYLGVDGTTGGVLNRWSASTSANVAKIQEYVTAMENAGGHMNFYSGMQQWKTITGDSEMFKSSFLWYTHNDGVATTADWATYQFGGWSMSQLAGKQYKINAKTNCSSVSSFNIGQDIWLSQ